MNLGGAGGGSGTSPATSQGQVREGFNLDELLILVEEETIEAKKKISQIKDNKEAISIGDMFEMQMLMNHLAQMSEMSTAVISASHSATMTMARNVKG